MVGEQDAFMAVEEEEGNVVGVTKVDERRLQIVAALTDTCVGFPMEG